MGSGLVTVKLGIASQRENVDAVVHGDAVDFHGNPIL